MDDRLATALQACDRATFVGDASRLDGADRGLDELAADLALTRGRVLHARFLTDRTTTVDPAELDLFDRALQEYRRLSDPRGEGRSLFWIGCFHQVVRGDQHAADEALLRAGAIAVEIGDKELQSFVLRHQGIAEHMAGRLEAAKQLLQKSTELRRELGMSAGVAANLVGLAYIAHAEGDSARATALIDEGRTLADDAGATAIVEQLDEAGAAVSGDS